MAKWQPIKTAPIGVDILLYSNIVASNNGSASADWAEIAIGQSFVKISKGYTSISYVFRVGNQLLKRATAIPTHWQPLPEPPSAQ